MFILTNTVDPIPLCPHCHEWPETWLSCRKARAFQENGWGLLTVCPSYGGDMKYYNWNHKQVSAEDFEKHGNNGFHEAKRQGVFIHPDCPDPEQEKQRILDWLQQKEARRAC